MVDFLYYLNLVATFASILGFAIGIPSLVFAIVQLRATKRASEAAEEAAKAALSRVSEVAAVASLEQICSRSRYLLDIANQRHHKSTAIAARELMEVVSKFSMTRAAAQIATPEEWVELQKKATGIHGVFINASGINKMDGKTREITLGDINELHSRFSMLAAQAGEKASERA